MGNGSLSSYRVFNLLFLTVERNQHERKGCLVHRAVPICRSISLTGSRVSLEFLKNLL